MGVGVDKYIILYIKHEASVPVQRAGCTDLCISLGPVGQSPGTAYLRFPPCGFEALKGNGKTVPSRIPELQTV